MSHSDYQFMGSHTPVDYPVEETLFTMHITVWLYK